MAALKLMVLWQREVRAPVILHSERETQFTRDAYQRFLKGHNLVCSTSAGGSCADHAAAEGFFGRLKRERVNRRRYLTRAEAQADSFDDIECFHNPRTRRRLETLDRERSSLTQQSEKMGENPGRLVLDRGAGVTNARSGERHTR